MAWTGRKLLAALGLVGAFGLGGCAYDDGYGYSGVNVGAGYYGGGAYDPYWGGGGFGPGLGWYDGFYYPGNGYYVYDRGGRRHRWNDNQRRYWEARRHADRGRDWRGRDGRPGWRDGQAVRPGRPAVTPGAQPPRPRWGERRGDGRRDWNRDSARSGWRDRGAGQGVGTPTQRPDGGSRWRGRQATPGAAAGSPRAQQPRFGSPRFGGGERGGGRFGGRDQRRGN